jgi:penicillin V acylase-like amidase (Ntn superfamily)
MRTRTHNLLLGALSGLLAAGAATESPSCTDFRIKAADGTVIIGRTMDFEVPVLSAVRIFPRGERWCSEAPGTSGGVRWTSKYRRGRAGSPSMVLVLLMKRSVAEKGQLIGAEYVGQSRRNMVYGLGRSQ